MRVSEEERNLENYETEFRHVAVQRDKQDQNHL